MSSFCYDSYLDDVFRGKVAASDTYYVMLADTGYTPDRVAHMKRADISGEVTGPGYLAGGIQVSPSFTKDTTGHRLQIVFPTSAWLSSTVTARYAVYYKRRGGDPSLDELVAVNDFGVDVSTTNGTFQLTPTTITITSA
jgi:hypothetical protein